MARFCYTIYPPPPNFLPQAQARATRDDLLAFTSIFLTPDGLSRIAHQSKSFGDKISARCLGEYRLDEDAICSGPARPGWLRACFDDNDILVDDARVAPPISAGDKHFLIIAAVTMT